MSPIDRQIESYQAWLHQGLPAQYLAREDTWLSLFTSPRFEKRDAAEAGIAQMYVRAGLRAPKEVVWCASPEALSQMRVHHTDPGETSNRFWKSMAMRTPKNGLLVRLDALKLSVKEDRFSFSQLQRVWFKRWKKRLHERAVGKILFSNITPWILPSRRVCFVSERPIHIFRDGRGRFHSRAGPAISYSDGFSHYAIDGLLVPEHVVLRAQEITSREIYWELNQEVRRVKIEQFGMRRYLLGSSPYDEAAEVIHSDRTGILYRKRDLAEPLVMVRVLNPTPEADGVLSREEAIAEFGEAAHAALNAPKEARFREYMLRVPPTMRTAHEAVAWTFGLEAEDYQPAIES